LWKAQGELSIYDVTGRLVRRLKLYPKQAGRHEVVWNGKDQRGLKIASGVYFGRLEVGENAKRIRFVVLR
jgi:flagellar hook assembly protein FlgD